MNDSLGALLALVVIWIVIKFAVGGSDSAGRSGGGGGGGGAANHATPDGNALGRAARMRAVPQEQVDRLRTMFPHVSEQAIRYDLLRTNNVETTCDRILREGGLPEPPSGLFTTQPPASPFTNRTADGAPHSPKPTTPSKSPSLIARYNLERRLRDGEAAGVVVPPPSPAVGKGKAREQGWTEGKKAREEALRDRKERMILEARRRLEEKQARDKEAATTTTEAVPAG